MITTSSQNRTTRLATLLPPFLFLSLLGLTVSSKANWRVVKPAPLNMHLSVPDNAPFLGAIDTPLEAEVGGYLLISGWATATTPGQHVTAVELYIDGRLVERVAEFYSRADVAEAYSRPDFDLSGWRSIFRIEGLNPAEHDLEMRLVTAERKSVSLMTTKLWVLE